MQSLPMVSSVQIKINENSRIPKYKQIVDAIINNISKGKLRVGEKLPSINELSENCYLSRDTVEKAYKQLKQQKIIISVKGKGFYTSRTELISKINVFFLVNKASSYKMLIYNSFLNYMGANAHVNLFFYHCEESLFVRAIEKNINAYDYYILMPHFKNDQNQHFSYTDEILAAIELIPKDQLIILDNIKPIIKGEYGAIFQDFQNDIYNALYEAKNKLEKYQKLILVYPSDSIYPYPRRILHGFRRFCIQNGFDFEVLEKIYDDMELQSEDVYIIIEDSDLVYLMKQIKVKGLKIGTDIGIISYNETPLKELLGITVISTDFKAMGEKAAKMVLKNKKGKIKNIFKYIERNSV